MNSHITRIQKILLSLFVIAIPLANRDLFRLGNDFILPVRVVFVVLTGVILYRIWSLYRQNGFKVIVSYVKEAFKDRLFLLLVLLWVVRVISIIHTLNLVASLSLLFFYSCMIVLYLILKDSFRSDIIFCFKLFKLYLVTVALSAFYALSQILLNMFFGITLPGLLVGGNYYRVPGPFYDANHLPAFLTTGIPAFVSFGWYFDSTWKRVCMYTLAGVSSFVLFLTFSRSGYIGFVAAFAVSVIFIAFYRYWSKLLFPVSIVILIALIVFLSDRTSHSILKRIFSVGDKNERSTVAHSLLLQGEIDLYLHNPVIGVGYGSFSEHFRASYYGKEHLKVDPTTEIHLPAHSLWFEVLAETGTLGIILYSAIMFVIVRKLLIAIATAINKEWRIYFIALLASVIGILTGGLFYSYNLEFFWFFLFCSYLLTFYYSDLALLKNKIELRSSEKINWGELAIPIVLVVVAGWIIFNGIGKTTLIDFDEAIYATIAKNMQKTGEYLIPFFRENMPWLEKPPLYMWLTAPMIKLFGIDAFPARFWSGFFGLCGVLITYIIGRRWYGRFTGLVSALVLLTTFHYLRYSRMAMTDVTLTFFMTLAFLLAYVGRLKRRYVFFAGIILGLGFMTKGVVALLMLPALSLLWEFEYKGAKKRSALLFVGAFLLTVLPWHLYVYSKYGKEFLDSMFGYHVLARFGSNVEGKTEPFLTYVVVIRNSLRIWYPVLLAALAWVGWKLYKASFDEKKRTLILLFWALGIFIPLSIAHSKLIWYIMPLYPVTSLFIGIFIHDMTQNVCTAFSKRQRSFFHILTSTDSESRVPVYIYGLVVLVLGVISFGYVYQNWALIESKDFNRDALNLTYTKLDLEKTGKTPLAYMGVVGEPFVRYYTEGVYEVWPDNMLEGLLAQNKTRYFIVSKKNAQDVLERNNNAFPLTKEAQSGDLILLRRPGASSE